MTIRHEDEEMVDDGGGVPPVDLQNRIISTHLNKDRFSTTVRKICNYDHNLKNGTKRLYMRAMFGVLYPISGLNRGNFMQREYHQCVPRLIFLSCLTKGAISSQG